MPARSTSNYVRLGLFVGAGLACPHVTRYLVGRQQNLFSKSLTALADFRNVSGLLTGNNVRPGGTAVGTVKRNQIIDAPTVRVLLNLNQDVRPCVRQNAVAMIDTDGLVGNIINLNPHRAAREFRRYAVNPHPRGHRRYAEHPRRLQQKPGTSPATCARLPAASSMAARRSGNCSTTSPWRPACTRACAAWAPPSASCATLRRMCRPLTRRIRQGRGPIGYLLTNKTFAGQLAATLAGLKRQV